MAAGCRGGACEGLRADGRIPTTKPCPSQIVCGNRAGALTILLDEHHRWPAADALEGEERPHFLARSLHEVKEVLQQGVRLIPPTVPPQPLDD